MSTGSPAGTFNLCTEFLEHNLAAGRGERTALLVDRLEAPLERWTFAEMVTAVRRAHGGLLELGVEPENRVLMVLSDVAEFAIGWFAAVRAGAVAVAVNHELKAEELAYYLDYTRAKVVLVAQGTAARLREAIAANAAAGLPRFVRAVVEVPSEGVKAAGPGGAGAAISSVEDPTGTRWLAMTELLAGGEVAQPFPTTADDVGVWLFTSGSTGHPKGAVHRHEDFVWNADVYGVGTVGYRGDDLAVSVPKLYFGYALGTNLLFPWRVGGQAVLFPERSTAERLMAVIERHRPTVLTTVPTMIAAMCEAGASKERIGSLRFAVSAGEALPHELYSRWHAATGVEVYDGIGSAEMFHIFITNRPGDVRPGCLGQVVNGYEARICDDAGQPVADGEIGTLWVRGRSTGLGYYGRRDASVHTFRGEWCVSADRFTRDAAGYYYYQGRADDLLKVGGRFVAPLEVENCLLGHGSVREAVVVGVPDGEGLTKPRAFLVLREGQSGSDALARELQDWVKQKLAPFKYPREVTFLAELPKNDRGKVDRRQLAALP
jgi:benzoate-CoA ligase family protein